MKRSFALFAAAVLVLMPAVSQAADFDSLEAHMKLVDAKQDMILQKLEEIKAELQSVKVRATNK